MRFFLVKPASCVKGEILLLGDKSIACRSIIISAISYGKTAVENFPSNKDCLSTLKVFKKLGIKITQNKNVKTITVFGNGLYGLKKPKGPIFVGNSGTTLRLTLGVLPGQNFTVTLTAGKSLSQRPMLRVTAPLRMMGAQIRARRIPKTKNLTPNTKSEEYSPITIKGGRLNPIIYRMPIASAQVKSAILLAGLYAEGKTRVIEPAKTRDHTERMLRLFKADIKVAYRCPKDEGGQNTIVIKGKKELVSPGRIFIPGDISSASFFMVLGTILPNSRILIKNVNLNPSRIGIIKILKRMGADIQVLGNSTVDFEPSGNIIIKSGKLKHTIIRKKEMPTLIDELPILMVAACNALGRSVFEGVEELRVKETDRIRSMSENLKKMGADIRVIKTPKSEKIIIRGGKGLIGATVKSFGDHRTAMSMVVAGLVAQGKTRIDNITCINKSFPNFLSLLKTVIQ